jgi:hypothetical protein
MKHMSCTKQYSRPIHKLVLKLPNDRTFHMFSIKRFSQRPPRWTEAEQEDMSIYPGSIPQLSTTSSVPMAGRQRFNWTTSTLPFPTLDSKTADQYTKFLRINFKLTLTPKLKCQFIKQKENKSHQWFQLHAVPAKPPAFSKYNYICIIHTHGPPRQFWLNSSSNQSW